MGSVMAEQWNVGKSAFVPRHDAPVVISYGLYIVHDDIRGYIAAVKNESDSKKIAAAPEMLEALELLMNGHDDCCNACRVGYWAIVKAKGGD